MMIDAVSPETINVKLNTLLEARREDLELRKEDRDRHDRERQEDRAVTHEMAVNISEMAIAITSQAKNNDHLNQRVDNIEGVQGDCMKRLRVVENSDAGDVIKWKIVIWGVGALGAMAMAAVAIFAAYIQPLVDIVTQIFNKMGP